MNITRVWVLSAVLISACTTETPVTPSPDAGGGGGGEDLHLSAIRGLELYALHGCSACHCNAAEGGCNLEAPGIAGAEVSLLEANLRYASTAEEEPGVPDFFDPHPYKARALTDEQLASIAAFLGLVERRPPARVDSLIGRGFDLYISGGCLSCHLMSAQGSNQGGVGSPIAGIDPDNLYLALSGGVPCHPLQNRVPTSSAGVPIAPCGVLSERITDNPTVLALTDTPPPDQDEERSLLSYFLAFVSPPPQTGKVERCEGRSGDICTVAGNGIGGFIGDAMTSTATLLYFPQNLELTDWNNDGTLDLIVVDWNNHRIRVVYLDKEIDGVPNLIETIAGNGKVTGADALNHPVDVAFDRDGNMIIATWHNQNIYRYPRGSTPETPRDQVAGTCDIACGPDQGPVRSTPIGLPIGIEVLPDQRVVFSETLCSRIRALTVTGTPTLTQPSLCIEPVQLFTDARLETLAGKRMVFGYEGDGVPGADAVFASVGNPNIVNFGISIEKGASPRKLYVADTANNVIRYIDLSRAPPTVHLLAGGPRQAGFRDGPAATARFNFPTAVYAHTDGAVYVADARNHAIRRIGTDGMVTTIAGTGRAGFDGDNKPAVAARLDNPNGVLIHPDGRVFISDTNNNRVRYVVP